MTNISTYLLNTMLQENMLVKKHNCKFIAIISSLEVYLRNGTIFDTDLMIAKSYVYLRKVTITVKLVKQIINP